jgi:hypothetical protein
MIAKGRRARHHPHKQTQNCAFVKMENAQNGKKTNVKK